MKLIIAIFFTLFSGSAFAADGYFGAKYEATYVDWGKVESLDLDEILGTTLNIFDIHYNYQITDNLKFGITATNVFDDQHRELIGGAKMGRQIIMRLTSMF